jgi:uncharacterized protein with von Willebrand factor type A (vWA) domain
MPVTRFPDRAQGVADRMAGFVAHLRLNGFALGPDETHAALASLGHVHAADRSEARLALKSVLVPDEDAWHRFDELFDAYWLNAGRESRAEKREPSRHVKTNAPALWRAHLGGPAGHDDDRQSADEPDEPDAGNEAEAEGAHGRLVATRTTNLQRRDLRDLTDEATRKEAERIAARLARAIRDRRSRRRRRSLSGNALDLRRTMRASLARGGEPLDLFRRHRPPRPMRIVAILDVSGSMTVYARVFLAFLKGLLAADTRADAYLFHTRLLRITPALQDRDSLRAAGRLSLLAEGFGGGTDIGGSLDRFVRSHAAAAVNGRTVVVILSDGYCTGSPGRIGEALARLRRRAGRIVWLNPLAGWRHHAPVAAGMAAALPHLDALLPANTLDSLAALEQQFARL